MSEFSYALVTISLNHCIQVTEVQSWLRLRCTWLGILSLWVPFERMKIVDYGTDHLLTRFFFPGCERLTTENHSRLPGRRGSEVHALRWARPSTKHSYGHLVIAVATYPTATPSASPLGTYQHDRKQLLEGNVPTSG